ncbi:MAG: sigma-70 family RNA polymerase sigma factor [Gammaproteobacteria bacterium]|nr:sigma-70 family RNA polymerase sigma factor [Gammaproteobacteria bacterium]MYJ74574.1 sigma-70 family RNA polymerase sigma factor [Gammaproteobacteria bacterium]
MHPTEQACNGGPSGALAAAFEAHHRRVFRAAFRVTGSVDDAEDILQTVFLNMMKRETAAGLDLGNDPKSYLCRAAVNAAVDVLRAKKRKTAIEGAEDREETAGPDVDVARRELRRQLRHALAKLSPRAASIVALRFFEGYGNVEIATMLGTSPSSIAVTLHRARQRLKAELHEVGP